MGGVVNAIWNWFAVCSQNFTKASRSYLVTEQGVAFLSTPYDIFVPHPDSFEDTKQKRVVARRVNNDKDSAYRNKHYLPKIREQLANSTNWFEVKEKSAYEYPGFDVPSDRIGQYPDPNKTVARVLLNKQDDNAYATAISEVFGHVTKIHPSFKNGHNLRQIIVDFDQAEYNGLEKSMGTEVREKIMRGCTVDWKTSVNRVSDIVTKSKEEHSIFRHLAHAIQDGDQRADVRLAFDLLCCKKSVIHAK